MRVLIVKTSSMGDILHTLPSLTDAAQKLPGIRFDWVVEEDFIQIPGWHKTVVQVIPVAVRRWRKRWFSSQTRAEWKAFRTALQTVQYAAIIDSQGLIKSAALVTRLGHGVKHGMSWKTAREPLSVLFYNQFHHISRNLHAVERTRELFAKSLGYLKPEIKGDYGIAQHFLYSVLEYNPPYLIFLHATSREDKLWPESHWRELIVLIGATGFHINLVWGKMHEKARAERLAKGFSYVNVLPRMQLSRVAEQLLGATAVVSVDTGLSHLAAALDRPNITLYGPTDPKLIGGYGKNQYVCRPKHSLELRTLKAETVFKKLKPFLIPKKTAYV